MSDEPTKPDTIETRMREAVNVADTIRIAREHAEARAKPLVAALLNLSRAAADYGRPGVSIKPALDDAHAALAAEARHREVGR